MTAIAIMGATGTIGSALAHRLAGQGQSLLLVGRNPDKLASLSALLRQPSIAVDFSRSEALEEALRSGSEPLGGLSGLVNCIGSVLLKPAHGTSDDDFRTILEVNLFTAFASVRACA